MAVVVYGGRSFAAIQSLRLEMKDLIAASAIEVKESNLNFVLDMIMSDIGCGYEVRSETIIRTFRVPMRASTPSLPSLPLTTLNTQHCD